MQQSVNWTSIPLTIHPLRSDRPSPPFVRPSLLLPSFVRNQRPPIMMRKTPRGRRSRRSLPQPSPTPQRSPTLIRLPKRQYTHCGGLRRRLRRQRMGGLVEHPQSALRTDLLSAVERRRGFFPKQVRRHKYSFPSTRSLTLSVSPSRMEYIYLVGSSHSSASPFNGY